MEWHDLPFDGRTVPQSVVDRSNEFWSKVAVTGDASECWLFRDDTSRYGKFCEHLAHRVAYAIHYGQIPSGMVVAHKCDVKACCNPHHLEAITQGQNTRDAHARGLIHPQKGEQRYNHKLTESEVLEVVRLHIQCGLGRVRIAKQTGFPINAVKKILEGRTWKHATGLGHRYTPPSIPYVSLSSRRKRNARLLEQAQ
jgi:hypothetical protein